MARLTRQRGGNRVGPLAARVHPLRQSHFRLFDEDLDKVCGPAGRGYPSYCGRSANGGCSLAGYGCPELLELCGARGIEPLTFSMRALYDLDVYYRKLRWLDKETAAEERWV